MREAVSSLRGAEVPEAVGEALATLIEHVVLSATVARTDELTGLPNRRYLVEELERQVAAARRYRRPLAALLVDIDGFKTVNDEQGHAAGDQLLRDVAALLKRRCRRSDFVARLAGDEFVVLLPDTGRREAAAIARELAEASSRRRRSTIEAQHRSLEPPEGR